MGACLAGAVALVSFDAHQHAALAPIAHPPFDEIEGQLVTPSVVGRRLEINPVIVFVTVMFWT